MGKKFDLTFLEEEESTQILNVLEKDFQLRMQERNRLSKLKKKIHEEDRRARLLGDRQQFNDSCCIRCFKRFLIIIAPKFRCYACGFNVCSKCCSFFLRFRDFVCITCQMEKDVMAQSCDWFYETVQRKFRQSGSAKVVRRLSASYKVRGKNVPVTGKMRASVLGAFSDAKESAAAEVSSTPESSETEDEDEPDCRPEGSLIGAKNAGPENSQREVLRKMKSLQITRFHERMREAMEKIAVALEELYPQGIHTALHRAEFRKFIHKARGDLTIILKNFSQILAITIESHNLAIGRASEDVQLDIQCILQDEVEGIVSRRIDVNFDESSSFITDEGSRTGQNPNVEGKLAIVILRKLLDDHRATFGGPRVSIEEEEMLRTFDTIIDETSSGSLRRNIHHHASSEPPKEVDPDLLSLSNVSDVAWGQPGRPRSVVSSQPSASSGSHWLSGGRPTGASESLLKMNRSSGARVGDREADVLSDLSGSDVELGAVNFDCAAFSDVSGGESGTPWAGTSSETEKKFLLQQLQHQETAPEDLGATGTPSETPWTGTSSETEKKFLLQQLQQQQQQQSSPELTDRARVKRMSRTLMAANQSVTGAAVDLETSAGQLESIMKQLSSLDQYIDSVTAKYTPATALRVTSDQGVKSAAKLLHSIPVTQHRDPNRVQLEEDIYSKAAEMANVAELIEELEDCLLLSAGHPEECPQHFQRWSSIDERVVSLVTRLEGDLHDVDRIQARMGTHMRLDTSKRYGDSSRQTSAAATHLSSGNSDVSFGYRPPSRNAWEEYKS